MPLGGSPPGWWFRQLSVPETADAAHDPRAAVGWQTHGPPPQSGNRDHGHAPRRLPIDTQALTAQPPRGRSRRRRSPHPTPTTLTSAPDGDGEPRRFHVEGRRVLCRPTSAREPHRLPAERPAAAAAGTGAGRSGRPAWPARPRQVALKRPLPRRRLRQQWPAYRSSRVFDIPTAGPLLSIVMSAIAQAIANRQSESDRLQAEIKALTDVEQILGASAPRWQPPSSARKSAATWSAPLHP